MKGNKTGGREKGVPNKSTTEKIQKCSSIKELLQQFSTKYFTPHIHTNPETGTKEMISDFEADLAALPPDERLSAQLRVLEFHTPKMKAIEVDLDANISAPTIEDRLAKLLKEN